MSNMTDYRVVVVGTDGSHLAEQTVARAAWISKYEDADLVIVCVYSGLSQRTDARNLATTGGDPRTTTEVIERGTASEAIAAAVAVASRQGATVAAALTVEGEPAVALVKAARERNAELLVIGATHDRSLAGRLLGTVGTEVVKQAPCDVLIVRPTGPEKQHRSEAP